ncbi:glycoprotein 3-alpha-L-fucosyltransferase A-like [Diadema antillarum]|uniref:glycoprotein 3-alpha-L-fucosyltransferase A-like n=1 Tax=Diadema antillarum TaxID=105358 RepID=UPI003A873EC7
MRLRRNIGTLILVTFIVSLYQLITLLSDVDEHAARKFFSLSMELKREYSSSYDARRHVILNAPATIKRNDNVAEPKGNLGLVANESKIILTSSRGRANASLRMQIVTNWSKATHSSTCYRRVHLWCDRKGELGFKPGVHNITCPGSTCDVTLSVDTKFDTMQKSEAVILYHWTKWDWASMHRHRPAGQKWVFYTLESPLHTKKRVIPPPEFYHNSYDYVMSFRFDSDFRADYGQYVDGKPELGPGEERNWAENRTKLVVWMASNCGATSWPRTALVKKLAKYIPVDMYGRCGNLTCQRGSEECNRKLAQYKFFLALENSECTDYITEKFWIQSLVRGLVPIVHGPPRSDYEKVAPPNSFIHIQDFATVRELAAYIRRVDGNDTLYNSYFAWKKKGSLKPYGTGPNIMCQVGDRLVADEKALANGTYQPTPQKDWRQWWAQSCRSFGKIPD